MIKLFWWLFKTFIWGNDLRIDLNYAVDFEDAMTYLKKGYFIYRLSEEEILYVKIRGNIYSVNTKKNTASIINGFTSHAMDSMWKIIPEGMQIEKEKNNDC
jgi:hypothetical protein